MGNGLATTTQIQAFRRKFGTMYKVQSMWMSATMNLDWLKTVDFDENDDAPNNPHCLNEKDLAYPNLDQRFNAIKPLKKTSFEASKDGKQEVELAIEIHEQKKKIEGPIRTLIIVNTVKRAQDIYKIYKRWSMTAE